jgi:hypothetical protein
MISAISAIPIRHRRKVPLFTAKVHYVEKRNSRLKRILCQISPLFTINHGDSPLKKS